MSPLLTIMSIISFKPMNGSLILLSLHPMVILCCNAHDIVTVTSRVVLPKGVWRNLWVALGMLRMLKSP
jgi:hypothetical protein